MSLRSKHNLTYIALAVAPPALIRNIEATRHRSHLLLVSIVYELLLAILYFFNPIWPALRDRWSPSLTDAVDGYVRRTLSTYTRRYRQYLRATTSHIDLKGLTTRGEYTFSLSDIFISLSLHPQAVNNLTPDPLHASSAVRTSNIWHWLHQAKIHNQPLAVIGPPGSGKTTLLKHVAHTLATGGKDARRLGAPRRHLPFLIHLRDHIELFREGEPALADLLRVATDVVTHAEPPGWTEAHIRNQRVVILLDGLDEIPDAPTRQRLCNWLDRQSVVYPDIQFIVTSRPFGYREHPLTNATVVQARPFTEDQVSAFLGMWYQATALRSYGEVARQTALLEAARGCAELLGRLRSSAPLMSLAVNPLLLTMIAQVHYYRGALPGNRSELYSEVCSVFLGNRHQARGVTIEISAAQQQVVLQHLALKMMELGRRDISTVTAVEIIAESVQRVSRTLSAADFLRRVEESSGLLLERERGTYAFAHLTFQEYLAACQVRDKASPDALISHIQDSWWRECIRLYAAQADATGIIRECLKHAEMAADITESASYLALAADCSAEGREVSGEERTLLDAILNPADAELNPVSRARAGLVRVLLRSTSFRRISTDLYLAHSPITNSEYQAFLDHESTSAGSRVSRFIPDHWNSGVYPLDHPDDPVLGLRPSDVVDFCRWLGGVYAEDQWSNYRVPRWTELAMTPTTWWDDIDSSALAVWCANPPTTDAEDDESHYNSELVDVREPVVFEATPTFSVRCRPGFQSHVDGFIEQLLADVAWVNYITWSSSGVAHEARSAESNLHLPIFGLGRELHVNYVLPTLMATSQFRRDVTSILSRVECLDVEYLLERVEYVFLNALAVARAGATVFDSETAATLSRLGAIAHALQEASAYSLNRAVAPSARLGGLSIYRRNGRLCITGIAGICYLLLDSEELAPKLNTLQRLYLRAIPGASLTSHYSTRQVIIDLTRSCAEVLALMVVLECRLNGSVPAWEAFVPVRDSLVDEA